MSICQSPRLRLLMLITVALGVWAGLSQSTLAQPQPDDSLAGERSQVRDVDPVNFEIEGGARRGANLFHSFREFNVDAGGSVYFLNPDGVANILSRVTGGNPSNILGTLGVRGAANLFLINPNGILFGPGSRLDVQGSFAATTADSIQFGEQGFFSASNPEIPALLTVNPSAYFFNQLPAGSIVNQSVARAGTSLSGSRLFGLRVPNGQNLLFLGGNVTLNGGQLNALGGRVEIAAVASTGTVTVNPNGSLTIPDNVPRADVSLSNRAGIETTFVPGGDIVLAANNIDLSGRSSIRTGIAEGLGSSVNNQAGDIVLNATGEIQMDQFSLINNSVFPSAIGNGGNIEITAGSLTMAGSSRLQAATVGQGNAGNIFVNVRDQISLDNAGIVSFVDDSGGTGNGGSIQIMADSLVLNDASINASTNGQGNGGNITINARNQVLLDNDAIIYSFVNRNAIGNGGNIRITAGSLSIEGAAQLDTSTFGQGNAGNIFIDAREAVSFIGTSANGRFSSGILTTSEGNASGNSGNVRIAARSFSLTDGATISAYSIRQGNAGNITIEVRDRVSLAGAGADGSSSRISSQVEGIGNGGTIEISAASVFLADGAQLTTNTFGQGNAGNIIVEANNQVALNNSAEISSTVGESSSGSGGTIQVNAGSLSITDGSRLNTSSDGMGDAGNIFIEADGTVSFLGSSADGNFSGAFSTVGTSGNGEGGTIRIQARRLSLTNGGRLQTGLFGQGSAGDVIVETQDAVILRSRGRGNSRGGILTGIESGNGRGGDIRVNTGSLSMRNSDLSASTRGRGNAGNVTINASDRLLLADGAIISSVVGSPGVGGGNGNGGNININTEVLALVGGSQLQTSTFGQGNAGSIQIRADNVSFTGINRRNNLPTAAFSIVGSTGNGNGGNIRISADSLSVADDARLSASTEGRGRAGNIDITANTATLNNGGQLLAETLTDRQAGNITLNVQEEINLDGTNSGIFANTTATSSGKGGTIRLNTTDLNLNDRATISADSQGTGQAGDIQINAAGQITAVDSDIVTTATRSSGGDITVNAGSNSGITILRGDSDITTNSQGNGGNITLQGSGIVAFGDSDILARSQDARGGNITLAPFFGTNTDFAATPPFDGNGQVDINADGSVAAGTITTPDTSLIQNSLSDLPETAIDPATLVADSCVVPSQEQNGTFTIVGPGGLPQRPGDLPLPTYPTRDVQSIPADASNEPQSWQRGDPIVEPDGAYSLEDGRIVLSRKCS